MVQLSYRVFEYAKSELEPSGVCFLIAIRICQDAPGLMPIRVFVREDWQTLANITSDFDIEYIEDFIYDLRQQGRKSYVENKIFFEKIRNLSVGPLRTSDAREIIIPDPDLLIDPDHREAITTPSSEAFNRLLDKLQAQMPTDESLSEGRNRDQGTGESSAA